MPISKVLDLNGQGQIRKWQSYSYELKYANKGISYWYLQSDSSKSIFAISVSNNFIGSTSHGLTISDTLKVKDVTKIYGKGEWDGYDIDDDGNAIIDCNFYDIGLSFTIDIGSDIDREDWRGLDNFYANNKVFEISIEEGEGLDEDEQEKFVPNNLEECFLSLDTLLSDSTRVEFKEFSKSELAGKTHFGLGIWMRNNWGLWAGSELAKFFNQQGIYHPDDMSGIILTSYHRRLNGVPVRLNKQIRYYQEYWKKTDKEQQKQNKRDFRVFEVGDTIEFNYNFGFTSEVQENLYDDGSCYAKGVILNKNNKELTLLIELANSCGSDDIIVEQQETYDQKVAKMKVKDQKWLHYSMWDY
ncbi:MAG: DUF6794 domain-containing protein [Balneolaceae bacterium]